MAAIEEVNLEKILPSNGPSINEVKKYLEKSYSEYFSKFVYASSCQFLGKILTGIAKTSEVGLKEDTTIQKNGNKNIIVNDTNKMYLNILII